MGKILFEHNQKAYEAAVQMMEQTGRAAVIHPTGTGKSFIAFQLCADRAKRKVCWLSPSEYIFWTQTEKWQTAGGAKLENVQFMTYAKLMRQSQEALEQIQPDYIVLDEFHRCGAAQWGGGVERLREMYPQAKVLGLSATNIRYLDNQRDMAWELFGGNVASELTLGAAVVQGILPVPKYVLSIYSYRKELQRYELRVRQARNKAVRDAAEKELEALRRALEKADGLEDVFARHMGTDTELSAEFDCNSEREEKRKQAAENDKWIKSRTAKKIPYFGKYIVFCANYEHLIEMRELAPEWFAKVDDKPHIYTAYSDDPATAEEFEAFKADQSRHLKLLYCIDMLNEGIHVDGVDGVILLRPTVSPTIYKQQIGRALAAGGKKTPVIFDIVMNIENLCSIGAIEEELHEAVFAYRTGGRAEKIVHERFQVIDEAADCRKLFMQLNETLGASWDAMYAMAKEYYGEHGNLEIPAHYTTADGYSLGAWIVTQRKVFSGRTAGCLSEEQIRRLSAIGMRWQGTHDAAWERNFAQAEKYYQEHGDLNVPADFVTEDGCRLGRWVRRQREVYRETAILLDEDESRQDYCRSDAGKIFFSEEAGNRDSALTEVYKDGQSAGKERALNFCLQRIKRLVQIGMVWENADSWERRFELAKRYYEEHGNLRMPGNYVVEGVWLDRWLREQKVKLEGEETVKVSENAENRKVMDRIGQHGKTRRSLSAGQKQKLAEIGIRPGVSQSELSWWEQYGEAEEFYRTHGNLLIPKHYASNNGKKLGIWLQRQRTNYRSGKLASWQVRLLDRIGMVWEVQDSWEQGLVHAKEYFHANGHLSVPNHYVCADGYRLGKWISNQRLAYRGANKELREGRVQQLEAFGMVWSARQGRPLGK